MALSCSRKLVISSSGNVPKQRKGNLQGKKEGKRREKETVKGGRERK
jgi:hypothetical protein